jgi:hypothetical protein
MFNGYGPTVRELLLLFAGALLLTGIALLTWGDRSPVEQWQNEQVKAGLQQ